jgi:hypothetical protein
MESVEKSLGKRFLVAPELHQLFSLSKVRALVSNLLFSFLYFESVKIWKFYLQPVTTLSLS